MGKRGPVATGHKRTRGKSVEVSADYYPPDSGMSAPAKKLWVTIVLSMTAGYFTEADRPQLRGYCEAAIRLARAAKEMNKKDFEEVYKDAKGVLRKNPWLEVYKDSLKLVNSTATKLRISKSTQIRPEDSGKAVAAPRATEPENPWDGLMFDGERAN